MTKLDDKRSARRYFSELRKNITLREEKEQAAAEILLSDKAVADADCVLIFCSVGSEISTRDIIKKLLDSGKKIALPKCHNGGIMTFHMITSVSELSEGKFGIPEPDETLAQPDLTDKTVCIVPALAFTESGHRLGYGGGFYDRFITAFPQVRCIGLCFEEQIADRLPSEEHDALADQIITEKRKVFCSAG